MNFENIKEQFLKFKNYNYSLGWIVLIGYLTWWNGLKGIALDKSFKWDEWFWFGVVPALVPYLFYYIWNNKKISNNKNYFKD